MIVTIQNDLLKVDINSKGSELYSAVFKGKERIWNGDPTFWKFRAPFLFPVVCRLKDQTTFIGGEKKVITNHGFFRDYDHAVVEQSPSSVTFKFSSNAETLKIYPFEFDVFTKYTLEKSKISIKINVVNRTSGEMLFSLGAHTGISTKVSEEDSLESYKIYFENFEENLLSFNCDENGLLLHDPVKFSGKDIYFTEEKLNNTIILSGFESKKIVCEHKTTGDKVKFNLTGHPFVGIWKAPNAPFLCIEPWNGHSDFSDTNQIFEKKPGIEKILTEKEFDFSIEFE